MRNATPDDLAALRRLPALISETGYADVYLLYGMLHLRRDALRRELAAVPPPLRALLMLFALGETVPGASLEPLLSAADQQALGRLGILLERADGLHAGELTLMPVLSMAAFVPTPRANPMAFFGEDVAGLLARLNPPSQARSVNLHAGPGLAALLLAQRCSRVIAVENSALGRACAELNAVMNGLSDRIEVLDAAEFQKQQDASPSSFAVDYLVANTPLLPFPQRLFLPAGDTSLSAAAASLSPTEQILSSLALLKENGRAVLAGAALGTEAGPAVLDVLETAAKDLGLSIVMTVPCHAPLGPESAVLQSLAWACHSVSGLTLENARDRLLVHLEQTGYHHLYLFYVSVRKHPGRSDAKSSAKSDAKSDGKSDAKPGVMVCRHDTLGKGFWFR